MDRFTALTRTRRIVVPRRLRLGHTEQRVQTIAEAFQQLIKDFNMHNAVCTALCLISDFQMDDHDGNVGHILI